MAGEYCLIFAGQSVQKEGFCRGLWSNPSARAVLSRLEPVLGADLEHVTTLMADPELALTFNAQRAIHAHHLGHWFAFKARHPGIVLDGVLGHSMGVVAALVAAGAMGVEDSGAFIRARARAFAEVCAGLREPQGLAAVSTESEEYFLESLADFPGLRLALHNSPGKMVVGGDIRELEALARRAREEGWPMRLSLLNVQGPYHTPAFEPARKKLQEVLAGMELRAPACPVFMGTSGRGETNPERIRKLLSEQACSPERHLSAVRAAHEHGCRNFLEVAAYPQPIHWVREQLGDPEVSVSAASADGFLR